LLLRSPKGTFVSEERAIFDEQSGDYNVNFVEWRPSNLDVRTGNLYVPAEYLKLGGLEIMLQEK